MYSLHFNTKVTFISTSLKEKKKRIAKKNTNMSFLNQEHINVTKLFSGYFSLNRKANE